MKRNFYVSLLCLILALIPTVTYAEEGGFTLGNLKFVVNTDGKTATLTGYVNKDSVSLTLPEVVHNPNTAHDYTLVALGNGAFKDYTNLVTLSLPSSVTTIGDRAFYNCDKLANLTLGTGVKTIGEYAFYRCNSITELTIPEGVTTIGASAIVQCGKLTKINLPSTLTTVGAYAFSSNKVLESVSVPDAVTSLGDKAFWGDAALKTVKLPSQITSLGESMFERCTSLTSIVIPDNVKSIGAQSFQKCASLQTVQMPENLETIGRSAFRECSSLESVELPLSLTSIDNYAFQQSGIVSIALPEGLKTIGIAAFESCVYLTDITLPASLTELGRSAFLYCSGLSTIRFKGLNPPTLGTSAFSGIDKDAKIYGNYTYLSAKNWDEVNGFIPQLTITDEYTTFCCAKGINISNVDAISAYTVNNVDVANGTATITKVEDGKINKATGVLITGKKGTFDLAIDSIPSATNYAGNLLVGVTTDTELSTPSGYQDLVLSGNTFVKTTEAVPNGKAYLRVQSDVPVTSLTITDGSSTTGINNIKTVDKDAAPYYTLSGIKVSKPSKGIYIHKGKKYIIK